MLKAERTVTPLRWVPIELREVRAAQIQGIFCTTTSPTPTPLHNRRPELLKLLRRHRLCASGRGDGPWGPMRHAEGSFAITRALVCTARSKSHWLRRTCGCRAELRRDSKRRREAGLGELTAPRPASAASEESGPGGRAGFWPCGLWAGLWCGKRAGSAGGRRPWARDQEAAPRAWTAREMRGPGG